MEDPAQDRRVAIKASDVITTIGHALEEGPSVLMRRLGSALRNSVQYGIEAAVKAEIGDLRLKGLISEDRSGDPVVMAAMAGMIEEAEDGKVDPRRVALLRRAFRGVLVGDREKDPDGALDAELFNLARTVTPAQARILASLYRQRGRATGGNAAERAKNPLVVAKEESGMQFEELFDQLLQQLRDIRLIAGGIWRGVNGLPLTAYGWAFCEFLNRGGDSGGEDSEPDDQRAE